ncbi:MAG TPA: ABC transporter permease subunit [Candidatus Methylomirabilis sp.]|nr:ABC transporter permease subunit [Candidatus Methylomirabilis sp.]HSC70571.1 ABC transporter permease subunit [Candidatus Methylomirabilis sp.]
MLGYVVRRVAGFVPVLFVIVSLSFFLMRLAPGGPFDQERRLPEQVRANIEARYHLDEPFWRQYLRYLGDALRGDLGPSFRYPDRSVNELLGLGFPVSLTLGLCALAVALLLGGLAGTVAGLRRNTVWDYLTMSFALGGVSVPNFVLGPILMLVFALWLRWLPVAGWGTWRHLILPSVTLGTFYAAYVARLTRAGMLEVVGQDFIRTARAKGLREAAVVLRHALPSAILPVVTYLGPASAAILTGSVVVETIFSIPGIGRYFVGSALNRDYTMVLGTVVFYSLLLLVFNLVVDVLYSYLDPRVQVR